MKFSAVLAGLIVAVSAGLWSGSATAAATYCSAPPSPTTNADGLSTSDVDFRGGAADDCYGVSTDPKNDSLTAVNSLGLWGGGWTTMARDVIGSSGDSVGSLAGLDWAIRAFSCDSSYTSSWGCDWNDGTFRVTVSDPPPVSPTPINVDMMIVLKASDRWAAYFFDAESFVLGTAGGEWDIAFKKNKSYPDLSHISMYLRADAQPPVAVPEPGTLGLLGLGMLGLAVLRRRRG